MNPDDLSPRMQQVVVLVGGLRLSYKAAARRLGISPHTVRRYAENVRDRMAYEDPLDPQDALTRTYWQFRDHFEDVDIAA